MHRFRKLNSPEEWKIVREIADSVWPETFAEILSPAQIRYMMDLMYAPETMTEEFQKGYRYDLLEIDGIPSGYMQFSAYGKDGVAKLHKLYLLTCRHHQGYGSEMLRHVEEVCREEGYRFLRLNVNKYNEKARRAYFRNGYRDVESVKNDIGSGFFMDDYVMEKTL